MKDFLIPNSYVDSNRRRGKHYISLTSEQLKILKLFYKRKNIPDNELDMLINESVYNRSFIELLDECLITKTYPNETDTIFSIATTGEKVYLQSRDSNIEYIKELLISKWSDVVVAFITALITALITVLVTK